MSINNLFLVSMLLDICIFNLLLKAGIDSDSTWAKADAAAAFLWPSMVTMHPGATAILNCLGALCCSVLEHKQLGT